MFDRAARLHALMLKYRTAALGGGGLGAFHK